MPPVLRALRPLVRPAVKDERELRLFIWRLTTVCVVAAIGLDILNNAVFFLGWTTMARSLSVTAAMSFVIAFPVIRVVGRAHLALYLAKAELEDLTRRDPMTGLCNRRAMMERAAELDGQPILLVVADIDRFKAINDAHGHMVGDRVITETAALMVDELGDLGLVCRTGGEEFALLCRAIEPMLLRRRLLALSRRVETAMFEHDGGVLVVTVSIGAAEGAPGQPFSEIYSAADRALYVAKSSGRNSICFDTDLERRLDPPLPPDEIAWVGDEPDAASSRRSDAA